MKDCHYAGLGPASGETQQAEKGAFLVIRSLGQKGGLEMPNWVLVELWLCILLSLVCE